MPFSALPNNKNAAPSSFRQRAGAGSVLQVALFAVTLCASMSAGAQDRPDALVAQTCPDLSPLIQQNPQISEDWMRIQGQLEPLLSRCLQSTEYFALRGAAQLNTGRLDRALESLERALLLNPDNGGAQVDYAQALYLQGQLFSAIDLNRQLLARNDLPPGLQPLLQDRERVWRGMTRQTSVQADMLVGYDNNLNGAPEPGQITLTLSGEPVVLPLNPEFRPQSGPYLNLRVGGRYRQLAPEHQHNVLVELRGRVSEDQASDLLQLDTRYAFIKPGNERSWQVSTGMSHLLFGGSPLYTATEAGGRYMPDARLGACRPQVSATAQYQLFHGQSRLNAFESRAGVGLTCALSTSLGAQQVVADISALNNSPVRSGRPGGSRQGWQLNVDWQWQLPRGVLLTQVNHTETADKRGYSAILADGARRDIKRSYVLFQYRQPLSRTRPDTSLLFNVYHQKQRSNLELFRSSDSTVEIGISHRF
ncbi:hypothetical protein PHACT_09495 [Pseudohongiella acticola]|uniref:Uncharacterized protein n=1 Tax=Pseudohongiella acticola TaxID=1524254 RepID=A0A1E8CLJ6_9GAMM|nr:tetratricopeptide repeat protein [Pseudohongiella acticola]OFE13346.1 hypothetical protein PHACT_09495 [Pseudohongiella acticola]